MPLPRSASGNEEVVMNLSEKAQKTGVRTEHGVLDFALEGYGTVFEKILS